MDVVAALLPALLTAAVALGAAKLIGASGLNITVTGPGLVAVELAMVGAAVAHMIPPVMLASSALVVGLFA